MAAVAAAVWIGGWTACAETPANQEVAPSPSETWTPPEALAARTNAVARMAALAEGAPAPDREWGLFELVDVGLERNPGTRQAWQNARSAAAQAGVARSAYYPTLTLTGAGGPGHTTTPTYPGFSKNEQISGGPGLAVTWLLLDFGSRSAGVDAARQALFASNFQFNKTFQDVIFSVMQAYYNLDSKRALLDSAAAILKLADGTLESLDRKKRVGLASQTDWLQARQNQAQARFAVEAARGDFINAQAGLMQTLGLPANAQVRVLPPPASPNLAVLDRQVDELIAEALNQRPDVSAKIAAFLQKKALARQAGANIWPTVTAGASAQRTFYDADVSAPPRSFSGSSHDNNYGATLTISMDLFDGLNKVNKARAARSDAEAAQADLTQTELGAIADVVLNYNNVQTAIQKIAASQALLEASQKAFEAARIGYKNGLNSILDLLTAQNNLASSSATNIQSRNDLFLSSAALARSTGSLTPKTLAEKTSPPSPTQP